MFIAAVAFMLIGAGIYYEIARTLLPKVVPPPPEVSASNYRLSLCGGVALSPYAESGVASVPGTPWCITVQEGDTAGGIARKIVGDTGRYGDLLIANSSEPMRGTPGFFHGPDEYNFAAGVMVPGKVLKLPEVWAEHVDEQGLAKGTREPWPQKKGTALQVGGGLVLVGAMVPPEKPVQKFTRADATKIALRARKRHSS